MLRLVPKAEKLTPMPALRHLGPEAYVHHRQLFEGYLQSHITRNHSQRTIAEVKRYLAGWFNEQGGGLRPLYVWEAMEPMHGRRRIVEYGKGLVHVELENSTIRRYLGHLRDFFSYVLQHPIVFDENVARRLPEIYGPIEQPVSEYDYPHHAYDGDQLGIPMDPEKLYDFYQVLKENYLRGPGQQHIRARDYSMAVLAGESGLRIDEIIHLETDKDLFFESKKIQTRHAKGMKGSGKRSRPSLFTPLTRATLRYYLDHHRPEIPGATTNAFLFINRNGDPVHRKGTSEPLAKMVSCAQKAGFPVMDHFTWHWFRRIFATRFIERFPDKLHVLIGLLGHVTPNTVHTYIRHSDAWSDRMMHKSLEQINTHGYSLDV